MPASPTPPISPRGLLSLAGQCGLRRDPEEGQVPVPAGPVLVGPVSSDHRFLMSEPVECAAPVHAVSAVRHALHASLACPTNERVFSTAGLMTELAYPAAVRATSTAWVKFTL